MSNIFLAVGAERPNRQNFLADVFGWDEFVFRNSSTIHFWILASFFVSVSDETSVRIFDSSTLQISGTDFEGLPSIKSLSLER